ncbi:MAG: hypothetical protein DMD83_11380 [Candidatus Rokuibacteriota bacterium]|nr:MAG: hypothetical protein DMD83_11380 [Candidatus Rokubacteria bacterium]
MGVAGVAVPRHPASHRHPGDQRAGRAGGPPGAPRDGSASRPLSRRPSTSPPEGARLKVKDLFPLRLLRPGLSVALLGAGLAGGQAAEPPAPPSSSDVARCIRDSGCQRTFVVSHRAHGFGAPENSRAAITRAVEAGVPLIKIDVRASKDGGLFLLHDGKLDRATTLRGRVEGFTSADLARARLSNGETLPRFADAYAIARGRSVLTVGFKADTVEQVADWIGAHGSFDDLIFFVNTGEEMRAAARAKHG